MINKKGTLALRDIMFMLAVFGVIMVLGSIFVFNMADEYSVGNMSQDYRDIGLSKLSDDLIIKMDTNVEGMTNSTETATGSFTSALGIINGIGNILVTVLKTPFVIRNTLQILMTSIGVPSLISNVVSTFIILILSIIIIFVIASSLLKGGKV